MRKPIEEIRRRELIEGAYRAFLQHGIGGLTTARICQEAGMSPGILAYYFKSKDEVLFWMVRHANRIVMDAVVRNMKAASNRWDRLMAIVHGNFPADVFDRNTARAWLSFYSVAGQDPQLERLQRLFHRRMVSNLGSCVEGLLRGAELTRFVLGVGVLIDGAWLRKAAPGIELEAGEAIAMVEQHIRSVLGDVRIGVLQQMPS
jgi:TetR/AcrR family transcriptional repressor of bet genes